MKGTNNFETVNAHAAGIDIGAEKIFVSVDGTTVVSFETFTECYRKVVSYLKCHHIERVAMDDRSLLDSTL